MTHSSSGTTATFWHGGAPGLSIGDVIIPRDELPLSNLDRHLAMINEDPTDTGRVYITTNRKFAIAWAIRRSNSPFKGARTGSVYRVDPIGQVDPDPDFPAAAGSYVADRAVILDVDRRRVTGSPAVANKVIAPFTTWSDGSRTYTADGWMTVPPQFRRFRITERDMRRAGQWASFDSVAVDGRTGQLTVQGQPPATDEAKRQLHQLEQRLSQCDGSPGTSSP